jgi:peptidoglycan/LPS O-acetylase OafA/YrhL
MVLQWFFIVPGTRLALTIINFIQFFLLGFLLADIYLADWKREPRTQWYWDVITMVGWPAVFWMSRSPLLISFALPIMLFVLYCAMFRGTLSNWLICNRFITTIGGMCYSIYLLHYQALSAVMRHTCLIGFTSRYWVNVLLQIALTGPFLLVIAGTYFLLIEQPCMHKDWLQRMALRMHSRWVQLVYPPIS